MNTGHKEQPASLQFWVPQSPLERLLSKQPIAALALLILLILGIAIHCWSSGTRLSFDFPR